MFHRATTCGCEGGGLRALDAGGYRCRVCGQHAPACAACDAPAVRMTDDGAPTCASCDGDVQTTRPLPPMTMGEMIDGQSPRRVAAHRCGRHNAAHDMECPLCSGERPAVAQ